LVQAGVEYLAKLLGPDLLIGDASRNVLLPTAVGALRPTALLQPSMAAGQPKADAKWAIVGFKRLKDFSAALIAGNLNRTTLPGGGRLSTRALTIDVVARVGEADSSGLTFARAFDDPGFRQQFAATLKPLLEPGEVVGLPAVLGVKDRQVWREIQDGLGIEIFEIPLPPPNVPGIRLNNALTDIAKAAGIRWVNGSLVTGFEAKDGKVVSVTAATTGAPHVYKADAFVYAPGGFESGALTMDSHYQISERLFGLPLAGVKPIGELITGDYWGDPQQVFAVGVAVDSDMRVVGETGRPVYENLYAAGGILAGAYRWKEKSGEGIALGSALAAARAIGQE
jgi:glycerol-3-phosphate dehydrogenase subunit B